MRSSPGQTACFCTPRIYAQKLSVAGQPVWAQDIQVSGACNRFTCSPIVRLDSAGNAMITWMENDGIYAQSIDPNGNKLWPTATHITAASYYGDFAAPMTSDDGTTVVVWSGYGEGTSGVFAQKLSADGTLLWHTGAASKLRLCKNRLLVPSHRFRAPWDRPSWFGRIAGQLLRHSVGHGSAGRKTRN